LARVLAIFEEEWVKEQKKIDELKPTKEEEEKQKKDCINQLTLFVIMFGLKVKIYVDGEKAKNESHAFHLLRPKFKEMWIDNKELMVCGYIDAVYTGFNGELKIVDYKTSKQWGPGFTEDYLLQCAIYALLYKEETGVTPTQVIISYLRTGEQPSTLVTPFLLKKAVDAIDFVHTNTTSRDIENYPCSQTKLCKYSPWFDEKAGICNYKDQLLVEKLKK
jgi:hypothetical protein